MEESLEKKTISEEELVEMMHFSQVGIGGYLYQALHLCPTLLVLKCYVSYCSRRGFPTKNSFH